MAKKTKEVTVTKKTKVVTPVDPVKTGNLLRLVSLLAVLLAIAAFLLQLFAVLTHQWKWQVTYLRPLVSSSGYHYAQPNVYEDSRLQQVYGLYSRDVKVYANNDEQFDVTASTRFPRIDDGEENLHYCLSQTSTLRGAFLTCSEQVNSPEQCHCRRYPYWKWVIFFEIAALVLLGLVVFLAALQLTSLGDKLRPVAAGLAFLAFLFLLIGLILILSYLKRETRSFADAYPHINRRVTDQVATVYNANQVHSAKLRHILQRRSQEFYRAYPLLPGQHPYNDTHFQEYSDEEKSWVYRPYTSINPNLPITGKEGGPAPLVSEDTTTTAPLYNPYGPAIGYDQVYSATRAGIGPSTILSILALVLSLLAPLLLAFGLLTAKKLAPSTTVAKEDYTAVPLNPPEEPTTTTTKKETTTTVVRTIPQDLDPDRSIGDAIVTTKNVPPGQFSTTTTVNEPVIFKDVVIADPVAPVVTTTAPTTTTTTSIVTTTPATTAETTETTAAAGNP